MRALLALALLAPLLAGCLGASTPQQLSLGLPVAGFTGLTSHAALVERLEGMAPLGVLVEPIGQSVEGRDLHLVRIGQGPFELWLAARHHGNEVTSTEAALNTLDYLLGRKAPGPEAFPVVRELAAHRALLLERLTFVIVPMANPDGAEADRRTNSHGQDLNRDYLLFTEPEPRAVAEAFWRAWPDAGLDLHNEGLGEAYDYDAYYPEIPRAESDTQELSLANQWLTVHEVEASGSYAGGPNENYVTSSMTDPCQYLNRYLPDPLPSSVPIPPPTGDTDPTAYCEGTHDSFLTLRGAPGWTPETALRFEGGERDDASLPWAIRQHEATIASTGFYYAGAYEGCAPRVQKFAGSLSSSTRIPVQTTAPARFQLVWREDVTGLDQNLEELDLALQLPSGQMLGPEQHPAGYTETLRSDEAGGHLATLTARTPLSTPYELRVHECAPLGLGLEVTREAGGLRAANTGSLPLQVEVQESLIGEHALQAEGAWSWVVRGNLVPKTMLAWAFDLDPGEARTLAYAAPEGAQAGPARWHAHGPAGQLLLGVGEERGSPAPS